ncbi:unnamed protein product [Closterium sp. NIES-53]
MGPPNPPSSMAIYLFAASSPYRCSPRWTPCRPKPPPSPCDVSSPCAPPVAPRCFVAPRPRLHRRQPRARSSRRPCACPSSVPTSARHAAPATPWSAQSFPPTPHPSRPSMLPHPPPVGPAVADEFAPAVGGEVGALGVVAEGEGGGCGGGGNVPEGTCPRPPLYSLSLQRLSLWGKGGGVRGWRERFCRASSRPSSSLSHSRACHCGGEGEAVAKVSQASAAAARCYRGTSNCRPYLHLLFLLLSAAVEWQVLPLSSAVPPPLFAARSCSPGGLLPYASTSAASTLAEGLVQLNLPPLHRLPLLLPAVAAFSALGVPLQEVYCIRFQL